ncbi:F-box protein SKP2A [Sesamum alatum]|uniref:F-box protein SKP2A n=1 Tax=Sesamum alatum TaxID=300844 RepID=A0AAE1YP95_9LAMI|nr:F-box protein SKP2A [Sesamum alatum]
MRGTKGLDLCFEEMMVFGGAENMMNNNNDTGNNLGSEIGGGLGGGLRIIEWKDIPVELLLRILSLVDDRTVIVASGVCHGWRDAVSWGLTHLSLSWCKKNMNDLVRSLVPKFTKLEVLILRQDTPQLQDDAVEKIATHCHDLQELDLSKSFRLTDRSLYALAHGCPNLIKLNISGCSAFSDTALAFLTGFCRKLKFLNLCGCVRAASDRALKAIGYNCSKLQSLNLGWCDGVGDEGVKSLAYGCPDLRALDLCGCVLITDDSVIALANNCLHLRSLDLYYCQNITDRAMYSLAQSRVKNKPGTWASVSNRHEEEGLTNLNISQCTALTPPAVQAVCDSFPALHTCPGRHSLIISGCLSLTSVHCACAVQAHHAPTVMPRMAH